MVSVCNIIYLKATWNTTSSTPVIRTKAVIHMGPHKTGTTSIQFAANLYSKELQQDGFDTVCSMDDDNTLTRQFSSCFLPPGTGEARSYPCNDEYLSAGSTIAMIKRNLFVSAEDFAVIGLQKDTEGVKKLSAYLSQWDDVTIVVYYRHYFSFLGSKYNQRMKNKSIERGHYKTIQDYMLVNQEGDELKYTVALVKRLESEFDNIVVMNMHDHRSKKGSPAESFFCHSVSFFEKTCNAIRLKEEKTTAVQATHHENASVTLHHIHLLAAAVKVGLLSQEKASTKSIQKAVQNKVESMDTEKMKMKCLASEILQDLWQKSLRYRRILFPVSSSSNSTSLKDDEGLTKDEREMKSEFELAAKSSLCMIDVDDAMLQTEWQAFFKSI